MIAETKYKYNEKEALTKLAEIKADQPPEFLMTKEDFKKSVLDNLPKEVFCPDHASGLTLLEGISKKGEPYRAYKCYVGGCNYITWTDRPAEIINAEVKDIESMLGINRPATTPAEGLEKKQKGIEKNINRRENSITEAAIRRDAAMFASVEDGPKDKVSLKQKLNYWKIYFSDEYKGENHD